MKNAIVIHTSSDSFDNDFSVLYFNRSYLKNQNHSNLVCYENKDFFFPVSIEQDIAISIPRSPFGSFFVKDSSNLDEFLIFVDHVKADLKKRNINLLKVVHPPSAYESFVDTSWLINTGFQVEFEDINQHINLTYEWHEEIHDMQKRKLVTLENEGFVFQKMESDQLQVAYQFIEVCRMTQELAVNITFDLLKSLFETTQAYDIFGVFRENKISALCISARVTEKVAYYYLPATSPMFRSQSPMVLLISGMVAYYRSQGFDHFDLGVSSIKGKPQESLRIFKERMGGVQAGKTSFTLQI